jgi:hypothetical protein
MAQEYSRAVSWLIKSLLDARPRPGARDRQALAAFLESVRQPRTLRKGTPERELARRLGACVSSTPAAREWLTDRLRYAGRYLAVDGVPPARGARSVAWRALILTAARLHESRVRRLPPASVEPALLDALTREGRARQPHGRATRTQYATPGPVLSKLAADRALQRSASRAIGRRLAPTGVAVYMYDPPRSHVPPHLDSEHYEVIVHVVLEHVTPPGARRSALIIHGPRRDQRLAIAPGHGVVLAGRGAVHQWEPLGMAERRMMIGVGFRSGIRDQGSGIRDQGSGMRIRD